MVSQLHGLLSMIRLDLERRLLCFLSKQSQYRLKTFKLINISKLQTICIFSYSVPWQIVRLITRIVLFKIEVFLTSTLINGMAKVSNSTSFWV